jgi:hypothetical protein
MSLKSISLPASLSVISGISFAGSWIETVLVDESNPHYFVSGDFLVAFDGMRLIRYFGHSETVSIDRSFEAIGRSCFADNRCLLTIAFEADSRLTQFGVCAFSQCSALTSICVPAQVEHISEFCFIDCLSLREVTFEQGSKLSRIDRGAFMNCHSLRLFVVPGQLEILGLSVFVDCKSLSQLRFEIPSRLRQLHLPIHEFDSLLIPDSVEVLSGGLRKCENCTRLLQLGRESRLMAIRFTYLGRGGKWRLVQREAIAVFVCYSEGSLRRFRCILEGF